MEGSKRRSDTFFGLERGGGKGAGIDAKDADRMMKLLLFPIPVDRSR